jgi:amino acid transporter
VAAGPPRAAPPELDKSLSSGGFLAIAIVSIGGPLALAALYVPGLVRDVSASAGLVTLIAPVAFAFPLLIWLRYAREIASSGGLFSFVEAAAGRRVALVQAAIWTVSYLLYLVYTTVYVVYDVLPSVLPGVRPYRSSLEVAIPIVLALVVIAGRSPAVFVLIVFAVGQLALVVLLAVVAIAHAHPLSSFGTTSAAGDIASASGNSALLFVCGSLPFFFGGEVARPERTIRRGVVAAYLLVAVAIVAAVFPLAANPAFTRADIPGVSVVTVYLGHSAGVAVGIGVAASIVGVMLVEYLALTRLMHAVRGIGIPTASRLVAIPLVIGGPLSLIDPDRFYDDLLKPSLIALWLSQIIVVAVFPLFLRTRNALRPQGVVLALGGTALMVFGLYLTIRNQVAS